jgi:hypothetical protein
MKFTYCVSEEKTREQYKKSKVKKYKLTSGRNIVEKKNELWQAVS